MPSGPNMPPDGTEALLQTQGLQEQVLNERSGKFIVLKGFISKFVSLCIIFQVHILLLRVQLILRQ